MQTFLPYASFVETARCLDWKRLGNQRRECKQVLAPLIGITKAWGTHPAILQWKGYERALCLYSLAICNEWRKRGYRDETRPYFLHWFYSLRGDIVMPPWLGMREYHESHQSALLRKDYTWYSRFDWDVSHDIPYFWPIRKGGSNGFRWRSSSEG